MILNKLTDHIYYLPLQEETDRPNLYYILGKNYSVAIDAGNSPKHVELFYKGLKELHLPLPEKTIITHWHWDHTFGLRAIVGESISSKLTYQKLQEVQKWKWTEEEMRKRELTKQDIPFCNDHILIEYPDLSQIEVVLPDKTIEEEMTLDLGDDLLQIIPQDSPHCSDGLFILDKRDKVLFVGDGDGGDFYNYDAKYPRKKLIRLIQFYNSLYYHIHFFSHTAYKSKQQAINDLLNILLDDTQTVEE